MRTVIPRCILRSSGNRDNLPSSSVFGGAAERNVRLPIGQRGFR